MRSEKWRRLVGRGRVGWEAGLESAEWEVGVFRDRAVGAMEGGFDCGVVGYRVALRSCFAGSRAELVRLYSPPGESFIPSVAFEAWWVAKSELRHEDTFPVFAGQKIVGVLFVVGGR